MDVFRTQMGKRIPHRFEDLLEASWIPWDLVARRHDDQHLDALVGLLGAYQNILGKLPVPELAGASIPEDSGGCLRCGLCCAIMEPGPVSARTAMQWHGQGALIADFVKKIGKGDHPSYVSWFYDGVRLRMCPLLLRNCLDGRSFCCVHHLGPHHRHPACSLYRPNPPLCTATALSLEKGC